MTDVPVIQISKNVAISVTTKIVIRKREYMFVDIEFDPLTRKVFLKRVKDRLKSFYFG